MEKKECREGKRPEGIAYRRVGVTLEEALELMGEAVGDISQKLPVEEVPLEKALGRIAGCDCISPLDQPPFDRSPLDGYALRASDAAGAGPGQPVRLRVCQEVLAGEAPCGLVEPGQVARIMTGAPIPPGADCVIRQEDTDYGEDTVSIYREPAPYENYCYAGEDFRKGDCLLREGTRLGAVELGILASTGAATVQVQRRLRAGVFTTGNELAEPGEALGPGRIYNSNLYVLRGRLKELGVGTEAAGVLPDTEQGVARALEQALSRVDVIFTTGGVSVGKKDILHGALELMGAEKLFWRVQVKPGTPTIFAMAKGVPILALSGNPFGALTHLELLGRPLLSMLSGDRSLEAPRVSGILKDSFPKGGKMLRIVRGYFRDGEVYLPRGLHSSGVLGSMQGCNCLMEVPAGSEGLQPGDTVSVLLLKKKEEAPWWMDPVEKPV